MEWRRVDGLPDYEVSEIGDVRRLTRGGRRYPAGYVLKPKPHQRGYLYYGLAGPDGPVDVLAHRLVAAAFLPVPPPGDFEVAHDDGTRTNNDYRNLRWVTPKENQADRKRHGTYHCGERCGSTKLSDYEVGAIKRLVGVTSTNLASAFGVSIAQISRIKNGKQRVSHSS